MQSLHMTTGAGRVAVSAGHRSNHLCVTVLLNDAAQLPIALVSACDGGRVDTEALV